MKKFALITGMLVLLTSQLSCWNILPGSPLFCTGFCTKCGTCHANDPNFQEDQCYYNNNYGEFTVQDCVDGCLAGAIPGHPMPPSWQGWSCDMFDDFL